MDAFFPDGGVLIYSLPPKVDDTIRVLIYDEEGNEINPDDVDAEIQWYADSIEITGADEAEYDVIVGDVGVKLSACVTIDGEEHWTDQTAAVEAYAFEIESAEATAVDTIEVTFTTAQDEETTDIVLTKNDTKIDATVEWDDEGLVATIKTTAKMTNGTYTVTATDALENEATADVEIESQHVDKIIITNKTALTNATKENGHDAHCEAYAYYDVLDQYGKSMRTGISITWSGSPAKISYDKSTGKITMLKNADGTQAWTYSDKIYITGVYTKTGAVCQEELSVGVEQALDTIEIAGFVKAGTTEIIDELPADFKTSTYYLVYKVLDQNGDEMKVTNNGFPVIGTDVTFISDNILLVKELTDPRTKVQATTMSIDGKEYARVLVTPGMKVSDGGEVNITAVANKTGNKTVKNIAVGGGIVLKSFELLAPTGVLADGEAIEIPFEATDTNDHPVTNFVNIAKQKTFNTLSFNASPGTLTLTEQADGTAKLTFTDAADAPDFTKAEATDGIDRKASLTAIVTGGETSNEMIDISDRARPVAIKAVNIKNVFVESAEIGPFTLNSFQYIDQYDRIIKGNDPTETWGDSTGFFAAYDDAATAKGSSDFEGHVYGVRTSYSGNGHILDAATGGTTLTTGDTRILTNAPVGLTVEPVDGIIPAQATVNTFDLYAGVDVASSQTGENLKFEIVKANKDSTAWDAVSTALNESLTIVDISKVEGFKIGDLNTFYVGNMTMEVAAATASASAVTAKTGDGVLDTTGLTSDQVTQLDFTQHVTTDTAGLVGPTSYRQTVKVTGTYNGKEVEIPANYFNVTGDKLGTATTKAAAAKGNAVINTIVTGEKNVTLGDLYDKTTAKLNSKPGKDTLTATIFNITTFGTDITKATGANYGDPKDTATKDIYFSDQKPKAVAFVGLKDSYTQQPNVTALAQKSDDDPTKTVGGIIGKHKDGTKDDPNGTWYAVDQYGVFMEPNTATYRITNVVENPDGWAENNFKVTGNGSASVTIDGAERGDTFDIVVSFQDISKTISITVGADKKAYIDSTDGNVWQEDLIGNGKDKGKLEKQRLAGLS